MAFRYYFIFIAVIGLVGGSLLFISRLKLLFSGVAISGVVTKKQKRTWSDIDGDHSDYFLVIEYTGNDGKMESYIEPTSIPTSFYKVGDNIELLQDPRKPNKIIVHSNVVLFSAPAIVLLLSAVAGYVGIK